MAAKKTNTYTKTASKPTKKTAKKASKKKATKKPVAKKKTAKKAVAKKKAVKKAVAKKAPAKKKTTAKKKAVKLSKAQSKENLNLLIGRALTDRRFRALVTRTPEKALEQYPLLGTEQEAVIKAARDPIAAAKAIDRLIDDTVGPVGAI